MRSRPSDSRSRDLDGGVPSHEASVRCGPGSRQAYVLDVFREDHDPKRAGTSRQRHAPHVTLPVRNVVRHCIATDLDPRRERASRWPVHPHDSTQGADPGWSFGMELRRIDRGLFGGRVERGSALRAPAPARVSVRLGVFLRSHAVHRRLGHSTQRNTQRLREEASASRP